MNQKLQRIVRDIDRTKVKIEELQALLPKLEKKKTELENAEIIKVFRSANVTPADFNAFVEECKANMSGGAFLSERPAPTINTMEEINNDEE